MSEILFHEKTSKAIKRILEHPPHALLIQAESGSGKSFIAHYIAGKLLNYEKPLLQNPNFHIVEPEKDSISIEQIRSIHRILSLRVPTEDNHQISRVLLIAQADKMTEEAQNALLKTLEEPPDDTVIILTATSSSMLRDTIVSRTTSLKLINPTNHQIVAFFAKKGVPDDKILNLIKLTGGRVGLINTLIDDNEHPLVKNVEKAKDILSADKYDRLILINELTKEKADVLDMVQALRTVAYAGMHSGSNTEKWHKILTGTLLAEEQLAKNAHTKLVLTNLFINL